MKSLILGIMVWLIVFQMSGQSLNPVANSKSVGITTVKTTSLVFAQPLRFIDRGSPDILVQQIKDAQNVIMIKAARKNFSETNLSVVTADGKLYSFIIRYDTTPSSLVYYIPAEDNTQKRVRQEVTFKDEILNPSKISFYADSLIHAKGTVHGVKNQASRIKLALNNIYIKDNVLFFQVSITNHSNIDYDIDVFRFYIEDRQKAKRTSIQQQEQQPLYWGGNINRVTANSSNTVVVALQKFTIPDAKSLVIQIMEKGGGRHLLLKIRNNKIIKARTIHY